MTVLDASVVIAGLTEPTSDIFDDLLRGGIARISTINLAEVVDVLMRKHGSGREDVIDAVDLLLSAGLLIDPLSARQSLAAGSLRARYFDKRHRPISMADCAAIALASEVSEPLAATDRALLEVAALEGVEALDPSRWIRPA